MTGPLVEIRKLSHSFGTHRALDEIALNVEPGSYTVLLGPSGSGKTTLLSILGGFLAPQEGQVFIRGDDCTAMAPARRPTATVFQDYALFPHLSVGDNVGFGLQDARRRPRQARTPRCARRSPWSALPMPSPRSRTSCRAASGSAWRSPARWSSSLPCCCSTSRSARST